MAQVRGLAEVKRFIRQTPQLLEERVLRGAARAGAKVIAAAAKERSRSAEVAQDVKVATRREDGRMIGLVQVKGPSAFIAPWLEYGTAPHFITVDDSQRQGRSVGRINRLANEPGSSASLVIGGRFVGRTVFHPGAQPRPFMRPALDESERDAVAAAQAHINKRVTRGGVIGSDEGDEA